MENVQIPEIIIIFYQEHLRRILSLNHCIDIFNVFVNVSLNMMSSFELVWALLTETCTLNEAYDDL